MKANYEMEQRLRQDGFSIVVGADEVGRGALAGPIVTASVVLPDGCNLSLSDSKKLTKKRRRELASQILSCAQDFGIGSASHQEIDEFGLTTALQLAYLRSLEMLQDGFNTVILDGSHNVIGEDFVICRPKADRDCACVAAASILAKVYRDELMWGLAGQFPDYGFDTHVGYGTAKHLASIVEYGPSPLQRLSFQVRS